MHSINELRLHNLNCVREVADRNKTEKRGDDTLPRGFNILGEAISAINRKKITDPKKQRREFIKFKKSIN